MKDEFLTAFRGTDMIFIRPNTITRDPRFAWIAQYGDRIMPAPTADRALQLAWSVWGGHIGAVVYA